MKNLKTFENFNEPEFKEIKDVGFLDGDFASTIILNNDGGTYYVLNWGNYPKVRHLFYEIGDDDKQDIEDWLCDVLRDYDIRCSVTITSISRIDKSEIKNSSILSDYPEDEIGNEVLKIEFKKD